MVSPARDAEDRRGAASAERGALSVERGADRPRGAAGIGDFGDGFFLSFMAGRMIPYSGEEVNENMLRTEFSRCKNARSKRVVTTKLKKTIPTKLRKTLTTKLRGTFPTKLRDALLPKLKQKTPCSTNGMQTIVDQTIVDQQKRQALSRRHASSAPGRLVGHAATAAAR